MDYAIIILCQTYSILTTNLDVAQVCLLPLDETKSFFLQQPSRVPLGLSYCGMTNSVRQDYKLPFLYIGTVCVCVSTHLHKQSYSALSCEVTIEEKVDLSLLIFVHYITIQLQLRIMVPGN